MVRIDGGGDIRFVVGGGGGGSGGNHIHVKLQSSVVVINDPTNYSACQIAFVVELSLSLGFLSKLRKLSTEMIGAQNEFKAKTSGSHDGSKNSRASSYDERKLVRVSEWELAKI